MKRVIPFAVCLVCFAISMGSCAALADNSAAAYAVVNNPNAADRLNVRTAPSRDAESLGKYYNGTKVQVLEDVGNGWVQVQIGNGGVVNGYMMKQYLAYGTESTVTPAMPTYRSSSSGWELYYSQSVNGSYTMHGYGETVALMGFTPEWWHIQVGEETGFVQAGLFSGDVLYGDNVSQSGEWNGPSGYHVTAEWTTIIDEYTGIVNNPNPADRLHLRTKPDISSESLGKYYNGVHVIINGEISGEWIEVAIGNLTGYMKAEYLKINGEAVKSAMPVLEVHNPNSSRKLHLRERQTTDSASLGFYPNGTQVTLMGFNSEWAHVIVDGEMGFMLAKYLK